MFMNILDKIFFSKLLGTITRIKPFTTDWTTFLLRYADKQYCGCYPDPGASGKCKPFNRAAGNVPFDPSCIDFE